MNLPGDEIARTLAKALAQKLGVEIVVSDCDNYELWTIPPKLNS
jgi:hypothetical protein